MQVLRAMGGSTLLAGAAFVVFVGVRAVGGHDYVGGAILMVSGLALVNAALELLRPVTGE